MAIAAEETLTRYLSDCAFNVKTSDYNRIQCETCNCSRSIYCFDCCRLLIHPDRWPVPIQQGSVRLPFKIDIILDDRRSSATGVQLKTLMDSAPPTKSNPLFLIEDDTIRDDCSNECRLFDVEQKDDIPSYSGAESSATYLLFPGPNSQPISSLLDANGPSSLKRLVVLDCKWSKSSTRFHPCIANLPRVHLDRATKRSFYWRWHNAGEGMLSTIEAVYYSAWEVATVRDDFTDEDRDNLVQLLWIFGLQRQIIQTKYAEGKVKHYKHDAIVPFKEDSKQVQRSRRAKQGMQRERATRNNGQDRVIEN